MYILGAILLVVFYPITGVFVDKYGLGVMSVGSVGVAIGAWWFFLAGTNYNAQLLSRVLTNFAGSLNATALLRLTNNWFAEKERPLAVAVGSIVATLGAGAALVYSPFWLLSDPVINFDLRSCDAAELLGQNNTPENINFLTGSDCSTEAEDNFCCAADANIDGLNLSIAFLTTITAIFAIFVVRDSPPSAPSKAGKVRNSTSVIESMKLLFSHWNYVLICIADFCATGPVNLVFATVDRIFPPTVSDFSTPVAAVGLLLAIPSAGFFARRLAKYGEFYELTTGGYCLAASCFVGVAILMLIDTEPTDYMVMGLVVIAVIFSVMWTVSVYELKIEYTFSREYALQGYIVSTDRTIINLSAVIFLFAIPPERYKGSGIDGRQFSFIVGATFVAIGALIALFIPKDLKRKYLRAEYEKEKRVSVANLMDYEEDVSKEKVEEAKALRASRRRSSIENVKIEVDKTAPKDQESSDELAIEDAKVENKDSEVDAAEHQSL